MAGLCTPLPTLRRRPCGRLRTAQGRCGSLLLHRKGLAPSTPCRSPGALRNPSHYPSHFPSPSFVAATAELAPIAVVHSVFNFRPQSDSVLYCVPLEESVPAPAADLPVDNVAIPTDTEITAPRDAVGAFLHTTLQEGGK